MLFLHLQSSGEKRLFFSLKNYPKKIRQSQFTQDILHYQNCYTYLLRKHSWREDFEPPVYQTKILYPVPEKKIKNLPDNVQREYEEALKVKHSSSNAFGVLIGRVIDAVCYDCNVKGKDLFNRIDALAKQGFIPDNLKKLAQQLRELRNVGGHFDIGILTRNEVPILHDICKLILQYVYVLPQMIDENEKRIKRIKSEKS